MKGTILEKIVAAKRLRIKEAKRHAPIDTIRRTTTPFRLSRALSDTVGRAIIAEFKRASPSRGSFDRAMDPVETAVIYRRGGAAAISVLTEEDHFNGSLDDLKAVRSAVNLPILRKDFVIDDFQIRESAAAGADAILLIASALTIEQLREFHSHARELGIDALVEVHNEAEMEAALTIGAPLIGVNNRNLQTFDVSLETSRRLARLAPPGCLLVAESGITSPDEMGELTSLGYSGFLIGETLMRSEDPAIKLAELRTGAQPIQLS